MAYGKVAFMAAVAMLSGSAQAAVRYDFTALASSNGLTGSFSYTADDFITSLTNVPTAQLNSCVVTTPAGGKCGSYEQFIPDTTKANTGSPNQNLINFNVANGAGFVGNSFYFQDGAFGKTGFYTSQVLDSNVGTLKVSLVSAGAVPEPASWAMMLSGFGLVGGALRRRRISVSFA